MFFEQILRLRERSSFYDVRAVFIIEILPGTRVASSVALAASGKNPLGTPSVCAAGSMVVLIIRVMELGLANENCMCFEVHQCCNTGLS